MSGEAASELRSSISIGRVVGVATAVGFPSASLAGDAAGWADSPLGCGMAWIILPIGMATPSADRVIMACSRLLRSDSVGEVVLSVQEARFLADSGRSE